MILLKDTDHNNPLYNDKQHNSTQNRDTQLNDTYKNTEYTFTNIYSYIDENDRPHTCWYIHFVKKWRKNWCYNICYNDTQY